MDKLRSLVRHRNMHRKKMIIYRSIRRINSDIKRFTSSKVKGRTKLI